MAHIEFAQREDVTRVAILEQRAPLRVLFPSPASGDVPLAAVVNTGGGVLGGDRYTVSAHVHAGAAALVMPQAAEKVYRSDGPTGFIESTLTADSGAWLEWLPQETILFQNARFRRTTRIDLDAGSRLLAGEILVFGRLAHGERMTKGLVRDAWQVRRAGRLVWADALHLDGDFAIILAQRAGFDGAVAYATVVHAAPEAPSHLSIARALIETTTANGVRAGASCVGGLLVARWLAADPLVLRGAVGAFWAAFRQRVAGLPGRLPTLWHV